MSAEIKIEKINTNDFKELVPLLLDHFEYAGMKERFNDLDLDWATNKFMFDYFFDSSSHVFSIKRLNKVDCIGAFSIVKSRYGQDIEAVERLCYARKDLSVREKIKLCSKMIDFMQEEATRLGAYVFRMGVWPGNAMSKLMKKKGFIETDIIYSRGLKNG